MVMQPTLYALAFSLGAILLPAAGENPQDASLTDAPGGASLHEVAPGIYEIGKLHLDQGAHTVSFPGAVNMDKGPLEYLLVTPMGSTHESLLVSAEIQPHDLHLAMLLIGAKGATGDPASAAGAAQGHIDAEYLKHAPKLKGDAVSIRVQWTVAGMDREAAVEDWVYKTDAHKAAERGPWIYNGSLFGSGGKFLADLEGAFVALVTNPSALVNNPRKGSDNDQVWEANTKAMPPAKTPVKIAIQLLDPPKAPPEKPGK